MTDEEIKIKNAWGANWGVNQATFYHLTSLFMELIIDDLRKIEKKEA